MRAGARRHGPLAAALAVMIGLRAGLLAADAVPFNADEAVVALMARHILQGARPVFFYGQAYLGSLDAWLVAGAFRLLGEGVLAVRVVQAALYAGVLITAYAIALRVFGDLWTARAVALWLAVPPVTLTLYTTASLGGYGEALFLGNLIWLAALRLIPEGGNPSASPAGCARAVFASSGLGWLILGALTGLGLWVFPLTGVYALPAWALALWAGRGAGRRGQLAHLALAAGGAVLGAAPWLWYTATAGPVTLAELSGSAIAGVAGLPPAQAFAQQLLSLVLFGPTVVAGLRPSWSIEMLALPLAPLAAAVYSAAVIRALRGWGRGPAAAGRRLWLGAGATLCAAFVLTPFGADPSGRYFLPLMVALAFLTADFLGALRRRWPRLAPGLALGLLAFNFWGTAQSAAAPAGLMTQFDPATRVAMRDLPAVIDFLREQGETRGYANYWVTFPLAFLSREELIFAARLPYHLDFRYTPRDDRYAPYTRLAAESPRAAYITTRHPPLDDRLRTGFAALGVRYREHRIGDFQIFYAFSRKVEPDELGLGSPCCR